MFKVIIENCKWGVDYAPEGMQINFLDEDSGIMVHIPFSDEAIEELKGVIKEYEEQEKTQTEEN